MRKIFGIKQIISRDMDRIDPKFRAYAINKCRQHFSAEIWQQDIRPGDVLVFKEFTIESVRYLIKQAEYRDPSSDETIAALKLWDEDHDRNIHVRIIGKIATLPQGPPIRTMAWESIADTLRWLNDIQWWHL